MRCQCSNYVVAWHFGYWGVGASKELHCHVNMRLLVSMYMYKYWKVSQHMHHRYQGGSHLPAFVGSLSILNPLLFILWQPGIFASAQCAQTQTAPPQQTIDRNIPPTTQDDVDDKDDEIYEEPDVVSTSRTSVRWPDMFSVTCLGTICYISPPHLPRNCACQYTCKLYITSEIPAPVVRIMRVLILSVQFRAYLVHFANFTMFRFSKDYFLHSFHPFQLNFMETMIVRRNTDYFFFGDLTN